MKNETSVVANKLHPTWSVLVKYSATIKTVSVFLCKMLKWVTKYTWVPVNIPGPSKVYVWGNLGKPFSVRKILVRCKVTQYSWVTYIYPFN